MALASKTKAAPKATAKAPVPKSVAAPNNVELERKVAALETALANLSKEVASLRSLSQSKPQVPAASTGASAEVEDRVNKMWAWLRKDRIFRSSL